MTIQTMNSIIVMMKVVAQQAAGNTTMLSMPTNYNSSFIDELNNFIKKINNIQIKAQYKAEKFELGSPGISLNDVMVETQKASLALHLGIQINNRLINAYREIMNMAV